MLNNLLLPITAGLGMVGGAIIGSAFSIIWKNFELAKKFKEAGYKLGYNMGQLFYKYTLEKVKDDEIRKKLTLAADHTSDEWNDGFDNAINLRPNKKIV